MKTYHNNNKNQVLGKSPTKFIKNLNTYIKILQQEKTIRKLYML